MNTKTIGDISEAMLIARFLELGYIVLQPFGDNQRYDLVIDRGSGFERVQCKTGNLKDGIISFHTCSCPNKIQRRQSYVGQVELFGVYCPQNRQCYLIPISDVPETSAFLRVVPSRNGQKKGIRMAQDYELVPPVV